MIRRLLREHPVTWLVVLPLLVACFDLRYHEHWRDEASPVLVARGIPWSLFWIEMRVEGIPFLFHALAKVALYVFEPRVTLVLLGALGFAVLLLGTYRWLWTITGSKHRSVVLTVLLSSSYAYAYELGVVVRSYALGLGFAFLALSYFREGLRLTDRRSVMLGTVFAGLSALTSAHSACVAGGALAAFVLLAMTRRGGLRAAWPTILATPAFLLTYWVARPFEERVREYNVHRVRSIGALAKLGVSGLTAGLGPSDWWFVDSMPELRSHALLAAELRSVAVPLFGLAAALALVTRAPMFRSHFRLEAFDFLAIAIGWVPLTVIVAQHYWGSYRHHLFFAIPAVVAISGRCLELRFTGRFSRIAKYGALALAAPWLVHQVALGVASFALDGSRSFSDTKAVAASLPKNAHVVSETDWSTVGMLLWRPDLDLSASNGGGRHFRYLVTDRSWHMGSPLVPHLQTECRIAPDRVFFVGPAASDTRPIARCLTRRPVDNPASLLRPQSWENISIWSLDCDCALSIAYPASFLENREDDDRR